MRSGLKKKKKSIFLIIFERYDAWLAVLYLMTGRYDTSAMCPQASPTVPQNLKTVGLLVWSQLSKVGFCNTARRTPNRRNTGVKFSLICLSVTSFH